MDITEMAMQKSLQMLQSAVSTSLLRKSMARDTQAMAAVLEMQPAAPQLAKAPGSMDIRV